MKLSIVIAVLLILVGASESVAQVVQETPQTEMVWILFPTENGNLGVIGLPAQDFNPQQFYACMAWYLAWAGAGSFAMGPAGPGFFFAASFAAAANCGYNAYGPKTETLNR